MRALLILTAASLAALLPASPAAAAAEHGDTLSFTARSGEPSDFRFGPRDGDRRRDRRRGGDNVYVYDRGYQGDSAWKSDSFNDWWHDRPERAYPHWMMTNQNCDKRWYQGDVLRC